MLARWLLTLLGCSVVPAALGQEEFARSANEAGGHIVLLAESGPCRDDSLRGYTARPGGRPQWGCWVMLNGRVVMLYDDGDVRSYDPKQFWVSETWGRALRKKEHGQYF